MVVLCPVVVMVLLKFGLTKGQKSLLCMVIHRGSITVTWWSRLLKTHLKKKVIMFTIIVLFLKRGWEGGKINSSYRTQLRFLKQENNLFKVM